MPTWLKRLLHVHTRQRAYAASAKRDFRQLDFLALDVELSSLQPDTGDILSIGYVPIVKGGIIPARGKHLLISDHGGVGDSAEYHGIRDCDRRLGIALRDAIMQLQHAAGDKPLIFHHARLDLEFLQRAGFRCTSNPLIDTLQLERRRLMRKPFADGAHQLRLYQCRQRYHLPDRKAHNAFTDALATAELFLAQCAYMAGGGLLTLKELVRAARL